MKQSPRPMSIGRSWRNAVRHGRAVLLGTLLEPGATPVSALVKQALRRLAIAAFKDPHVERCVAGVPLQMPLSHQLPRYLKLFPEYSHNLGRLAKAVNGPIVDVGANIGDSVAIVRAYSQVPILCIEGSEFFLPFLRENVRQFAGVVVAPTFVGNRGGDLVERPSGGTLSLVRVSGQQVAMRPLRDILVEHSVEPAVRLLKVDTDGFDAAILLENTDLLERVRPVIFFEYDTLFLEPISGDGLTLFDTLDNLGYRNLIFYDNRGQLLFVLDRYSRAVVGQMGKYIARQAHQFYLDVAAFHLDDHELFVRFVAEEQRHFGDV